MKYAVRFMSLWALLLFASSPEAEIPQLINYQGMLTDEFGNPLTGSFNLTFYIYDDTTGGDLEWSETQNGVQVQNGLFNVVLGKNSALNLAFDQSYWLAVKVGTETMPRVRFTSVGYAYRALVADSAQVTAPGSGSNWSVNDSVLYTNKYWGIARGGAGNEISGYQPYTQVNLGVNCTTSVFGDPGYPSYATISGGYGNRTTDGYATISGGYSNKATGDCATVGGGATNNATDSYAVVSGGRVNEASGYCATVSGGEGNVANGSRATVGGGWLNTAYGIYATVSGGFSNEAPGQSATISGGYSNEAPGNWATVPGGYDNTAQGNFSFAAGRKARANHAGCFVWADTTGGDFVSTGANQFLICASGGVGIGTSSPSSETRMHVQANSDDFGVLVDAAGASGSEIGLHTATSQYASLAKNAYFDGGAWQRFNTSNGAYLQEVRPGGEVWFRIVDAGTNPISWTNALTIENNGKVGIGTTDPNYRLDVNGDVNVSGSYNVKKGGTNYVHPDYVFEPDYDLISLDELRRYVFENKCLPKVISAEDVKENEGFKMDELLIQMLEKIEEQTLYILELEERITKLEETKQ
jgi:hypothetical protein